MCANDVAVNSELGSVTVNYPYSLYEIRAAIAEFRALGLRSRVINRLRNHKVRSLEELGCLTEADLRRIPGIGETTIKQLRLYLHPDTGADDPAGDTFVATMILTPSLVEAIDFWVKENFERVSRADAIGTLIRLGLEAQSPMGNPRREISRRSAAPAR
jgi:hypothetical protein